jgi:hypothetical protein
MLLVMPGGLSVRRNAGAIWQTTSPSGITINKIWVVGADSRNIGDGHGYRGEFFWDNGSAGHAAITDQYPNTGCCRTSFNSRHIGWYFACNRSRCSDYAYLQVGEIYVTATENQAPTITPSSSTNLWSQHQWVRGTWPIAFGTGDPSGVCATDAGLGSQVIQGTVATPQREFWHQCPDQSFSRSVNTNAAQGSGGLGEGNMQLVLWAKNAAGVVSTRSETVQVDNHAPTISLSGPATASTTAGTQYIAANATAGPSGVEGIGCSLDGGQRQWYPAPSVRVPVSGFGTHHLTCASFSNAKDGSGQSGASAPTTWTIDIRQPSISTVSFARVVGRAHCVRVKERIRIPAQWVTVVAHGRQVRVRIPAQTRVVKRLRCRTRVVLVRVRVHGHWVTRRVPLGPRTSRGHSEQIRYGAVSTISGWLGTSSRTPLPGQRVWILTAPDDGSQDFTVAASAVTSSDGTWSARLGPGPSRLVKVQYGGDSSVEPSESPLATVIVPASLKLKISPRYTHWGRTIAIRGRLLGGYVPPKGELVLLRVGWRGGSTEVGHLYSKPDGTFESTYTFLRGNGTETYRFWAATASESAYPYAPHRSAKTSVTVGP